MMERKFKITPINILYAMLMVILPVICVGGVSVYPAKLKFPGIIATGIICLLLTLYVKKKIVLDTITVPMLFLSGYILISASYSLDPELSMNLFVIYISSVMLLFADLPETIIDKIIFIFKIFAIVIAVSIILSVFIDDFILKFFSFIVNPKNSADLNYSIRSEIKYSKAYSGLSTERSDAAYIMNVGISLIFADYFSGKKLKPKDFGLLILFVIALVFTNKRTLFLIPVITFSVLMLLGNVKSKLVKYVAVVMVAVVGFITLAAFIPEMSNIYNRFVLSDSHDVLNGRGELWHYSTEMFAKNPIFGFGFGSFNEYAFNQGLRIRGGRWDYYGHNCYYELAGELGIVGVILFLLAFVLPFVYTFAMIKRNCCTQNQNKLLMFSLYVQIMFLIYSMSGNVIYYTQQIAMWFFAIAITAGVRRQNSFRFSWKFGQKLNRHTVSGGII